MIHAFVCVWDGGGGGGGRFGGGGGGEFASASGPMCMFVYVIRVTARFSLPEDKNKVLKSRKPFDL